jgi:hypothetical protein
MKGLTGLPLAAQSNKNDIARNRTFTVVMD